MLPPLLLVLVSTAAAEPRPSIDLRVHARPILQGQETGRAAVLDAAAIAGMDHFRVELRLLPGRLLEQRLAPRGAGLVHVGSAGLAFGLGVVAGGGALDRSGPGPAAAWALRIGRAHGGHFALLIAHPTAEGGPFISDLDASLVVPLDEQLDITGRLHGGEEPLVEGGLRIALGRLAPSGAPLHLLLTVGLATVTPSCDQPAGDVLGGVPYGCEGPHLSGPVVGAGLAWGVGTGSGIRP